MKVNLARSPKPDGAYVDVYTETGWRLYQTEKERKAQLADTVSLSSDDEPEPPKPRLIALGLQAQGQTRVRLRVADVSTRQAKLMKTVTIAKLSKAYRNTMKVPPEKKITILLDGDPLDEDETIKNLDVDNDELLDVQVE